jgi:hypothetical protein
LQRRTEKYQPTASFPIAIKIRYHQFEFATDPSIGIEWGTGNVFRYLGSADADVKQLKTILAAEIIKNLDERGLTVRKVHEISGYAAADFSCIRNANLNRNTVDRLIAILKSLVSRVEVSVRVAHTAASAECHT